MADLINTNMPATDVVAALDDYGDFSVSMTATEFVGEVNMTFSNADASVDDTASDLVRKVNNTQPSPGTDIPEGTVLKFLHYSDPHAVTNTTVKVDKMLTDQTDADYDADIAFALLTGDNVAYNGNAMEQAIIAADKGKYLVMMGNHDASDIYHRDNHVGMVEALRGFQMQGGVTYGGQTDIAYWHKDFAVSGLPANAKVRLIATDEYETGGAGYSTTISQAQVDWFIGLLDELGKDDYIIVATHKPPYNSGKTPWQCRAINKFCSNYLWSWDSGANMLVFADIINAYVTGGSISKSYSSGAITVNKDWSGKVDRATFLCFLFGHIHGDAVIPHPVHNRLLVMGIDTCKKTAVAGYDESDITDAVRAAAGYELLNKVTVDFHAKRIRIDRIGCKEVAARTIDKSTNADKNDIHDDGYTYPALTRDNITFDFNANVVEEGGAS